MTQFIMLSCNNGDNVSRINVDSIESYTHIDDGGSNVRLRSGPRFNVSESPDQIDKLINQRASCASLELSDLFKAVVDANLDAECDSKTIGAVFDFAKALLSPIQT